MIKQLLESFKPSHYDLSLTLNRHDMTFHGRVEITGTLHTASRTLQLHAKELAISKVLINSQPVTYRTLADDILELTAKESIHHGQQIIELEFNGTITDPMHGLYPCYFEENGKKQFLLATQFESHHAREVFPCIDEPAAKATFDLTLTTAQKETVLANTPIKKQSHDHSLTTTVFETTPVMSTYLLAFVAGPMKCSEATTKDGVLVRVWSTPKQVKTTKFGLGVAIKSLEYYNDYFMIDYPLAKCDLVALPDFSSGAMENWGLITFRESCLLVDEGNTTLPARQYVAMVVGHELAHQWFGNLVTMQWWDDLWLNEGFASWIEYLAVDHIFPEWQMWTQFVVDEMLRAQHLDALHSTHAIQVAVDHPSEIRTIFDAISYQKGASVIRMLHDYLGAADFRNGLSHYLKKHAYANAETKDLWEALEEASGKPVSSFMKAWITQAGFPIVRLDQKGSELHIEQERFVIHTGQRKKMTAATWPIPLGSSDTVVPEVIDRRHTHVDTPITDDIRLNTTGSGFFITQYAARPAQFATMTPIERLLRLSDSFQLAKAGYGSTLATLDLLDLYTEESQAPVWDIISGVFGSIRSIFNTIEMREALRPVMRDMTKVQVERLGWKAKKRESYFDSLLRPHVLGISSLGGEPIVVQKALKLFDSATHSQDIDVDIRGMVLGTTIRERNDLATYTKLKKWYDDVETPDEKITLISALISFKDPAIVKKSIVNFKKMNLVKPQDLAYWMVFGLRNPYAREAIWQWIKTNWSWIVKQFGNDMHLTDFVRYPAQVISTKTELTDYKKFFASVSVPGAKRTLQQGIEQAEINIHWRDADEALVLAWLQDYEPKTPVAEQ